MSEGSAVPLSPEQEDFLVRVVVNSRSGVRSPFIFVRSHSGSQVIYAGATHLAWKPRIDEFDIKQFSQAGLITIQQVAPHQYQGKPTAAGVAHVDALTQSGGTGAGSVGNAPDHGSLASSRSANVPLIPVADKGHLRLNSDEVFHSNVPGSSSTAKNVQPDPERLVEGKEYVNVLTAAMYLGLSRDHVRRLARTGKLLRVGRGRVKISVESLRKYKFGLAETPA